MRNLPSFSERRLAGAALFRVCLATFFWALAFGVHSQLASHWLAAAGASNTAIGWNHGAYYLGLALGCLAMMRAAGPAGCAALGMVVTSLCQVCFPLCADPGSWFILRLLGGLAGAWSIIPLETWISRGAPPGRRTQHFAYFGLSLTLGGALGIGAGVALFTAGAAWPFWLGGMLPLLGAGVLHRLPGVAASHERAGEIVWRHKGLSLGSGWYQGFLEGGMLAFLSLFLLSLGHSQEGAGVLLGATMLGVIVFQPPVAWLADRLGARAVLLSCYAVVLTGLVITPWCGEAATLGTVLFLVGACSGAMYPLGLALLGEGLSEAQTTRAYSWYLALECVGSQLGAATMGMAKDAWGDAAMFGVGAAAGVGVLAVAMLMRASARGEQHRDEQRNEQLPEPLARRAS